VPILATISPACLIPQLPGFDCDVLPYPGPALRVALVVVLALALGYGLISMGGLSRWLRAQQPSPDGPQGPMFAVDQAHSSAATAPPVDPGSIRHQARQWFGQTFPGSDPPAVELSGWDGKAQGLRAIKAHDPGFDQGAFEAAVQRVFFAVLEAWTRLKPALSQGVMAPVIWEQQRAQVEEYRRRGRRNQLEGLTLTNALVVGAQSDPHFDTITVRMSARSADFELDAAGAVVGGYREMRDWTEDWVFQRPASAASAKGSGPVSQLCPNCGAPILVDVTTICTFCGAPVISGRFQWLLTRIDRV
jgi:predicted lipid-binding transport protein (Tim44 family)